MKLLKFLALIAIFALVSCSDSNPACSCNENDPGGSSSSASTILQTEGLTFVSGQELPTNYVDFRKHEFGGFVASGGTITLDIISANEMTELYLKIEKENGYYVRVISAENIVSAEPEKYVYHFAFVFSPDLNYPGEMKFTMSGKAKN